MSWLFNCRVIPWVADYFYCPQLLISPLQVGEHEEKELKASEELACLRFEVMDSQNETRVAHYT